MAGKEKEVKSRGLEWYKNFNKLTLVGSLGFAVVAAHIAPVLVIPALGLAAYDFGQIVVLDKINKKKDKEQKVIYQASGA